MQCRGPSIQCLIETKFGEHSYFIWTNLTLELHTQISLGTSTFEVKAWGPTRPFNEPIFDTHIYSWTISCLYLVSSSMHTLYGVFCDVSSSSIASRHSFILALIWPDGHLLKIATLLVLMWGSQHTLFTVWLWYYAVIEKCLLSHLSLW